MDNREWMSLIRGIFFLSFGTREIGIRRWKYHKRWSVCRGLFNGTVIILELKIGLKLRGGKF